MPTLNFSKDGNQSVDGNFAKQSLSNSFLPKVNQSLADIAEHICQIKRRSDGNLFLKRAKEHFFII